MIRSYKYKLRMNRTFLRACEQTLDSCRDLYNAGLSQRISNFKKGKSTGLMEQLRQLTEARELPEVRIVLRTFQVNTLRRLDRAYQAFFRRVKSGTEKAGFPRFKGYDRFNSFNTTDVREFRLVGDRLTVQRIGSCRVRLSRPLGGRPKTLTIRREFDGWYAIIGCDEVQPKPLSTTDANIGVDVGLEKFATLSDGRTVENPRFFRKSEEMLAKAQQRLSLKKHGSKRRKHIRRLVAKAHAKIKRQRDWFHWQVATTLVKEFDGIAVEKLNVKGMAQSNLAKSIHDAGWADFVSKLSVKAEEAGRLLVRVNAKFTSQTCSGCGKREKKTLAERWHECSCGVSLSRDHNAALNILARAGPALLAGANHFQNES